ncbi:MAG TPA: LPD29 domain-containing protein [Steroidobacteraceae bacterium]|nr:LPD29 domain-containing protein [Steroidobacteraceae bacterium]
MYANELVVGQRVYCGLYYCQNGTIVAIHGEQSAATITPNSVMTRGCNARIDIVWDNGSMSRQQPEAMVRGSMQWKVRDEVVGADTVCEAIEHAARHAEEKAAAEAAEKIAKAHDNDQARVEGVALGLIPEDDFRAAKKRGSAPAYNLRTELKKAGIKASVKQDGYNCINVYVAAGQDRDQAKAIAGKYKAGHFDGMTDCYEYAPDAWGRVFGDVQYVFLHTEREEVTA